MGLRRGRAQVPKSLSGFHIFPLQRSLGFVPGGSRDLLSPGPPFPPTSDQQQPAAHPNAPPGRQLRKGPRCGTGDLIGRCLSPEPSLHLPAACINNETLQPQQEPI